MRRWWWILGLISSALPVSNCALPTYKNVAGDSSEGSGGAFGSKGAGGTGGSNDTKGTGGTVSESGGSSGGSVKSGSSGGTTSTAATSDGKMGLSDGSSAGGTTGSGDAGATTAAEATSAADTTSTGAGGTAGATSDTEGTSTSGSQEIDACPDDPDKTEPGVCGCGVADDSDCLVLADALVHRYSFNGTGNTAADTVGSADGTVVDALPEGGRVALSGGAYVDLPSGIISSLANVTVEVWFTWNGGDPWQRVFDFGNSDAGGGQRGSAVSYLYLTPQAIDASGSMRVGYSLYGGSANEVYFDAVDMAPTNRVVDVAVVIDSGLSMALCVDGAVEGAVPVPASLSGLDDINNWLGMSQYAADPSFEGIIHELRIYDFALTAAEVQKSFQAGPDAPLGT